MNLYGLIGFPLSHSFSKKYFTEKFEKENITDSSYELFEIDKITKLRSIIRQNKNLRGLNVTIPYKQQVMPFLNYIEPAAKKIGAVNVLKITPDGKLEGYNTDYYGFIESLKTFLDGKKPSKAAILGTGGASKAVKIALDHLKIPTYFVSRRAGNRPEFPRTRIFLYRQLTEELIQDTQLIINTTPLGMSPNVRTLPEIKYECLHEGHMLYDLVYNPEETLFLKKGKERGAKTLNGLPMLHLQAEKSWDIWNDQNP